MKSTNIYKICIAKKGKILKEYHISPWTYIQAQC